MRVTVLGNPDRYLAPLAGGSGYLVDAGGVRVLLDCGPGVRDALARLFPDGNTGIDAVVVSHFHFDHVLDLVPVLKSVPKGCALFAPQGGRGNLAAVARAYGFEGAFDAPGPIVEARAGEAHSVKTLKLEFAATEHGVASVATRIRGDARYLVYASDTAPCQALHGLARKADLAIVHTLLARVEPGSAHEKVHMTATTAGEFAKHAQVKRLLLSHRFHDSKDDEMLAAATGAGAERVELAMPGATYAVE